MVSQLARHNLITHCSPLRPGRRPYRPAQPYTHRPYVQEPDLIPPSEKKPNARYGALAMVEWATSRALLPR